MKGGKPYDYRGPYRVFLYVHRTPGTFDPDGRRAGRRTEKEVSLVRDYDFLWFSAKVLIVTVFLAALLFVASTVNVTFFLKVW